MVLVGHHTVALKQTVLENNIQTRGSFLKL